MNRSSKSIALAAALLLAAGPAAAKKDKAPTSHNEWFLQTYVEATNPATGDSYRAPNPIVFGQLAGAQERFDRHDIPHLSNITRARAGIVFLQTEWDDRNGQYLSDYRGNKQRNQAWRFSVFSAWPGAEITLDWTALTVLTPNPEGSFHAYSQSSTLDDKTLRDLVLVDLESGAVVAAVSDGELNRYTFRMGPDGYRTFLWVAGPMKKEYFDGDKALKKAVQKALKQPVVPGPETPPEP